MIQAKLSMHIGKPSQFSLKHNFRNFDKSEWNKDQHIDYSRTNLNVVLENVSLKKIYENEIKSALDEYNEKCKGKHNDRIKSLEKYFSETQKNAREIIFQLGDMEEFNALSEKIGFDNATKLHTDFLKKVYEDFQNRNPSMKIFSAVIHCDESTPHLHLDFIPVAEFDRGMSKKISFEKAMENISADFKRQKNQKMDDRPFVKYQRWNRESLEQLARTDESLKNYFEILESEKFLGRRKEVYEFKNDKSLIGKMKELVASGKYTELGKLAESKISQFDKLEKENIRLQQELNRAIQVTKEQEQDNQMLAYALEEHYQEREQALNVLQDDLRRKSDNIDQIIDSEVEKRLKSKLEASERYQKFMDVKDRYQKYVMPKEKRNDSRNIKSNTNSQSRE